MLKTVKTDQFVILLGFILIVGTGCQAKKGNVVEDRPRIKEKDKSIFLEKLFEYKKPNVLASTITNFQLYDFNQFIGLERYFSLSKYHSNVISLTSQSSLEPTFFGNFESDTHKEVLNISNTHEGFFYVLIAELGVTKCNKKDDRECDNSETKVNEKYFKRFVIEKYEAKTSKLLLSKNVYLGDNQSLYPLYKREVWNVPGHYSHHYQSPYAHYLLFVNDSGELTVVSPNMHEINISLFDKNIDRKSFNNIIPASFDGIVDTEISPFNWLRRYSVSFNNDGSMVLATKLRFSNIEKFSSKYSNVDCHLDKSFESAYIMIRLNHKSEYLYSNCFAYFNKDETYSNNYNINSDNDNLSLIYSIKDDEKIQKITISHYQISDKNKIFRKTSSFHFENETFLPHGSNIVYSQKLHKIYITGEVDYTVVLTGSTKTYANPVILVFDTESGEYNSLVFSSGFNDTINKLQKNEKEEIFMNVIHRMGGTHELETIGPQTYTSFYKVQLADHSNEKRQWPSDFKILDRSFDIKFEKHTDNE